MVNPEEKLTEPQPEGLGHEDLQPMPPASGGGRGHTRGIVPTMRYDIGVKVDGRLRDGVDEARLRRIARRVLEAEGVGKAEVSVVVTGDAMVRALNRRYCGEDASTDVLSFALREGEDFVLPPGESLLLGEVVISLPTARRQANLAGQSVEREVALLLIHGLLHLLGYDHAVEFERERMEARQEALLAALGVL